MSIEQVLKQTWELTKQQWQFVALVALIGFAINLALGFLVGGSMLGGLGGLGAASTTSDLSLSSLLSGAAFATMGVGMLVSLLVAPWLTGASAHAGKLAVEGNTRSAWAPFQAALGQYVTFLLLGIVLAIALGIGFMLFVIPGITLAVLLAFSPMAVAVDNLGVGEALKRAWALGMKHFWTILLVGVVIAAVSFALALVTSFVPLLPAYLAMVMGVVGTIALAVMYKEAK